MPYVQIVKRHKTDREVALQVKREIKNMDKAVAQAYMKKVKQLKLIEKLHQKK